MKTLLLVALAALSFGLLIACDGGGEGAGPRASSEAAAASPQATPGVGLGKIAYVQNGDIWVKALPDGEPDRLTPGGINSEPRWSPSGDWLAFRGRDDRVWVMEGHGGEAFRLSGGTSVTNFGWAPNEDRLAFVAGGTLKAVDADEGNEQVLVGPGSGQPGTGVVNVAWSPDGEWLAYSREDREELSEEAEDGRLPERYASLWRVRADGSDATELVDAGTPSDYGLIVAGWSPDGSHVLYWIDPHFSASAMADGLPLYAVPASGGEPRQLNDGMLLHPDFMAPRPAGVDQLAVIVGGYRGAWENKVLHVLSPSAGQDATLTSPDEAVSSPAWSPDGRRIAYVAMPDGGDLVGGEPARQALMQRRIFVASTPGDPQPRQLTDDPAYRDEYRLWSADGASILFARIDAHDRASLWLIPAAGGEPRQVVDELSPPPEPAPSWLGYYGHVDWDKLLDWWREPAE